MGVGLYTTALDSVGTSVGLRHSVRHIAHRLQSVALRGGQKLFSADID